MVYSEERPLIPATFHEISKQTRARPYANGFLSHRQACGEERIISKVDREKS